MNEHPVLGQVVLGYSPMIDRKRAVIASHLTVFPLRADAPPEAAALLRALGEVWTGEGEGLALNIASETLLRECMALLPPAHIMLEVPAFMAANPDYEVWLRALHAQGTTLLIKGRPATELPPRVLPFFKYSIIDIGEDRRIDEPVPQGVIRQIGFVQSGIHDVSQVESSFRRGAAAVLGWPVDEPVGKDGVTGGAPEVAVVVELINRVDRQEPVDRLEAVLKDHPDLAVRLLRYINSPAFGLPAEIGSFQQAVNMLGFQKLQRWLALLLASASTDLNMTPVMFAAVRRGLLMEELVRSSGSERQRSEMFICGVFSLLDCMMGQPFDELLQNIPVPKDVFDALVHGTGPHRAYLEVVLAVEQESLFDIRAAADRQILSVAEVNRALLRALVAARQID